DSSFQLSLVGRNEQALKQYAPGWDSYRDALRLEQNNITLPGEAELVDRLAALTERYRRKGDSFYVEKADATERQKAYFGPGGLLHTSREIKEAANKILRLNQDNMEQANREARQTARRSLVGFGLGLALIGLLAIWLAWRTIQAILLPIRS